MESIGHDFGVVLFDRQLSELNGRCAQIGRIKRGQIALRVESTTAAVVRIHAAETVLKDAHRAETFVFCNDLQFEFMAGVPWRGHLVLAG